MTKEECLRYVIERGGGAGSLAKAIHPDACDEFIEGYWEITKKTLKSLHEKGLIRD